MPALLALFLGGLDVHVGHLLTIRVFNEALGLADWHVVLIDLQTNSSLPIDRTLASHVQSESLSTGPLSRGLSCGPLLRARRQRPRDGRAAEQPDERAPPHSINSSARASSVGDTSRPNALAVLRLITSSYLVGACTGSSPGFSPLRMRST
jgi:hypothetical protein